MNLLSPLALLGLLGLALPLMAHLLGRERPQTIRFAAVRFVRPREPVVTQRRAIRDWPLFVIRLLLLAVLVLVLARPVVGSEAAVAVIAEPHDAVILLDASASMELRVDDRSDRERARERLEVLLDALPPGSRVGLVISDPRAPTVELRELADGAGQLRAAVDGWSDSRDRGPRPGPWTLAEALPRASAMLGAGTGEGRPRVIYAIGDPTDRGLGSLPATVEGSVTVIPVPTRGRPDAEPPAAPEHVGIREVGWEPAPELDPRAVRVRALIRRYGGDAQPLTVEAALDVGDEEIGRTRVELDADGEANVEFTHTLTGDRSGARARVRLLDRADDALTIDDRRHLWLAVSDAVEVLLVNGDPSENRVNDEIFFLSTALGQSELGERLSVRGLAPDQLEAQLREPGKDPLAGVDLLILANVRALDPALVPKLLARVRAGMGLWITVGDRVSAADYNAHYAELLPLLLREAVYAGTAPGRTEARSEALAPVQLSHPIFAGVDAEAGEAGGDLDLGATRTRRMFLLEPDPRRGADIAVAFSSGAPALITRSVGQGRVALLTTTVDRDWGDLPLRPGFVPLATRTVQWLAGVGRGGKGSVVGVGSPKPLERAVPYSVTTPRAEVVPVTPPGDGEVAVFEASDEPGHYLATPGADEAEQSEAGASTQAEAGAGVERFVVVIDPRESDTTPAAGPSTELAADTGTVTIYQPRWRELALLALLLLAAESVLRARSRRRRP